MASTSNLSPATRERLEHELEQLREQRKALAPRLGEDPLGDSADQANLLERAETVTRLDRRIGEIFDLLHSGPVNDPTIDALRPGTKVTLKFSDGDTDELVVVGIAEEAEDNLSAFTADSPLGKAIAGHKKGDKITYRTPHGEETAEIVKIRAPR